MNLCVEEKLNVMKNTNFGLFLFKKIIVGLIFFLDLVRFPDNFELALLSRGQKMSNNVMSFEKADDEDRFVCELYRAKT